MNDYVLLLASVDYWGAVPSCRARNRENKEQGKLGLAWVWKGCGLEGSVDTSCRHTNTHLHTYSKASWLLTVAELLWRGEYYPRGTSFTSSIFTEFLCVLLLLIIQANHTHAQAHILALTSPYHTLFLCPWMLSGLLLRSLWDVDSDSPTYCPRSPLQSHPFCCSSES